MSLPILAALTAPETTDEVPVSCSLEPGEIGPRLQDWQSLLERAASRTAIDGGVSLGFPSDPEVAAELAATAVAEQNCCSFYRFDLRITGQGVFLNVTAPKEAQAVLTSMFGHPDG